MRVSCSRRRPRLTWTGRKSRCSFTFSSASQRQVEEGYRRPVEIEVQLARLTAHSRQAIGDAAFDVAATNGRALDIDAAMTELRRWLDTGII